jgi:hypothetical protein
VGTLGAVLLCIGFTALLLPLDDWHIYLFQSQRENAAAALPCISLGTACVGLWAWLKH